MPSERDLSDALRETTVTVPRVKERGQSVGLGAPVIAYQHTYSFKSFETRVGIHKALWNPKHYG